MAVPGAGTGAVVTTLWRLRRVDDKATRELTVAFYRRLWVEEMDPHRAVRAHDGDPQHARRRHETLRRLAGVLTET
jgi:hypothetical protein